MFLINNQTLYRLSYLPANLVCTTASFTDAR